MEFGGAHRDVSQPNKGGHDFRSEWMISQPGGEKSAVSGGYMLTAVEFISKY